VIDLSSEIGGVRLKSALLPGSSELAFDGPSAGRLVRAGAGAVVTKTFTSPDRMRIRIRPYEFPLARFGKEFASCGSFVSFSAPHVAEMEKVLKMNVREMVDVCRLARVPLIASFYEDFGRPEDWSETARRFEEAGADLIELNFSSPSNKQVLEEHPEIGGKIISIVRRRVRVPAGIKISPTIEPLEKRAREWHQAGVSFITAHNAPSGIFIDVEREEPYGAPSVGGYLMGRPFLPWSLGRIVQMKQAVPELPVIGIGGISEWQDALQYLLVGCVAVGVATGVYAKGLGVFRKIEKGIAGWMERKGYGRLQDFQGKVLPMITSAADLKLREIAPFAVPPNTPYAPRVDPSRCSRCFTCGKRCLYAVFRREKNRLLIDEERCWSCGACIGVCPTGALVLADRTTGELVWDGEGTARPFRREAWRKKE
jgi:dihydropyrimidine dehydrogenase (NAD+) subunit PreA